MKRDFTQATYQAFCDMVREIERAKLCDVTDWIGDRYYDVKHFFGDIGLYDKMSNQDKYRREMMDKENTSVEKIREIFEKVSSTDSGFAAGGGMCLKTDQELFSAYRKALRELSDQAVQAPAVHAELHRRGSQAEAAGDHVHVGELFHLLGGVQGPVCGRL